jgi:hypothetical protein
MPSRTTDRLPLSLSARVHDLHPSPIREILEVVGRPGMISFAGGLPAAETFPDFGLAAPDSALQYGPSEGDPALRERIALELAALGLDAAPDRVLVLSGSQQGIDLVGKLFIDAGTPVAVESPTYLAALQVFRFFGARFALHARNGERRFLPRPPPGFAYAIPTFQNPTGRCYTAAERAALAEACMESGVPMFEDDPYRDLVFDACDRRPVCAGIEGSPWIYQGSFSKSLAPGLRLGFLAASPELFTRWCASSRPPTCTATASASGWCCSSSKPPDARRGLPGWRISTGPSATPSTPPCAATSAPWPTGRRPPAGCSSGCSSAPGGHPPAPAGGHRARRRLHARRGLLRQRRRPRHPAPQLQPRGRSRDGHRASPLAELVASAAWRGSRARAGHLAGPHPGVELLAGHVAQRQRRLAQGEAGVVGVLGDGRGAVVADVRAERRHQHQRARHQLRHARPIHLDAPGAVASKLASRRPAGARSPGSCERSAA